MITFFFFNIPLPVLMYLRLPPSRALVSSTVGGEHVSMIVSCLTSVLSSLYDPQRVVVAAFFAQVRKKQTG